MEAHQPRAGIFRAETVFGQAVPDLAGCAILGDFFEEVIVRVEEETQPGTEFVEIESAPARACRGLDPIVNRECEFLPRGRTRFANVGAADRNRVEARSEF